MSNNTHCPNYQYEVIFLNENSAPSKFDQACSVIPKRPNNILDKIIVNFCSVTCFVTSIILMFVVSLAALFRYILKVDLYGYEEWVKMFAFWLYFMGSGLGAFYSSHVSADLIQVYVKPGRLKHGLICLRTFFTLLICFLFTWYGYKFFFYGIRGPLGTGVGVPTTSLWNIPFWTSYLAIFLGLIIMSWYFLFDFISALRDFVHGGNLK